MFPFTTPSLPELLLKSEVLDSKQEAVNLKVLKEGRTGTSSATFYVHTSYVAYVVVDVFSPLNMTFQLLYSFLFACHFKNIFCIL